MILRSIRLVWLLFAPFRHRGNRWTRKAERRQDLVFWDLRDIVRRAWFNVLSVTFKQRHSFRKSLTATTVLWKILRVILLPILLSGGFVVFLIWLDQAFFPDFPSYLGDSASGVLLESFEGARVTLLATGAQVTGIFLGLYFTTIGVVASMAYGDVPPELRSVLIEDKIGGLYLRVAGFTAGACLFGLGAQALGLALGFISVLILTFLSAASVLAFFPLGRRVFGFLNPRTVTRSLMNDIKEAVRFVLAPGVLAKEQSIQAHHRKIVAHKLDAWEEMVFVSSGRSHSVSALRVIGQNAVLLLHWYSEAKLPIARTNQWFERVLKHPSYLVTGGSRFSVAVPTGTKSHPELEPDQLWLEKRICEIVQRVVVALSKEGEGGNRPSVEVLDPFYDWIAGSAHQFRVLEMEMGFQVASRIERAIRDTSLEASEMTDHDRLHGLAVLDGLARAITSAAGHLNRRLRSIGPYHFLNRVSNAAISEALSLKEFSPRLRVIIESLRLKYSFERDVEGSIQTPRWFTQHHAACLLSIDIRITFESLLDRTEQRLPSQAKSLRETGAIEAAGMVIQRGLEAVSKLENGAVEASCRLMELKNWRRERAIWQEWPSVNLEQWHERLRGLRLTFINELVHLTPLLSTTPPTGDLPDSLGFAYANLCDAMIEALENLDAATFKLVYPVAVTAALKAQERVKTELAESPDEDIRYFSVDVTLDIIDVSGYAYLWKFSLGEDRFWNSVERVWDTVHSKHEDPSNLIKGITLGQEFRRQRSVVSPRSEIRRQWKGRLQKFLESKGFALHDTNSNIRPRVIAVDSTTSAYLAAWRDLRSRDLMLSEYILKRPETEGLPVPREVEELRRGARRVLNNRAAGRVEGDPENFGK